MATLTLTKLFINRVATTEFVSAYSQRGRAPTYEREGTVRTNAGGRQRAVSQVGERGTYAFVLQDVTQAQITSLREWMGETVEVRDNRGQQFFGVYFALGVGERDNEPTLYTVAISLRVVSYDAVS